MKFLRLGMIVIVLGVLSLVFAAKANAATFTVDSTGDGPNVGPGCNDGSGVCTLRAAIEVANSTGGADTINFNITGSGVHTIAPASALPGITERVTIDATTQTGASTCTNNALVPASLPASNSPYTLLVEIDGTNAITGFGQGVIQFTNSAASSSVVRGLVINRVNTNNAAAILLGASNVNNVTIECNYLGTNPAGTSASANGYGVSNSNNSAFNNTGTIIQNNLISGNSISAISIASASNLNTQNTTIKNNLIGTSANGLTALTTSTNSAINTRSVQTTSVLHNVISGNGGIGSYFGADSFTTTFRGNYVGLGVTGSPLGNAADGVVFYSSSTITIGGSTTSNRNVISANTGDGLHIYNNCNGSGQSINSTTYGNYIGTKSDGSVQAGYGNGGAGIEVNEYYGGCVSVYKHQIGGDAAGQANIIAGNAGQGILVHQSSGQDVFSITSIMNSIYGNGQFGMDLAADSDNNSGVADTDLGPNAINNFLMSYPATNANYYINRPIINSNTFSGNQLTVNYSYQANGVTNNFPSILASNLVGFRLDFYINDGTQDGAYAGYAQGKTHLGSFIINGSATNATHTFTSPIPLTGTQNITSTATAIWQIIPDPGTNCQNDQWGDGPPYFVTCIQ